MYFIFFLTHEKKTWKLTCLRRRQKTHTKNQWATAPNSTAFPSTSDQPWVCHAPQCRSTSLPQPWKESRVLWQGGHRRAPHLTLMPQGPAPGRAGGALHTLGPQLGAVSLHTPSKSSGVFIFRVTNANLLLNYISVRSSLSPNRNYYLCRWGQHWQGSRNLCLK